MFRSTLSRMAPWCFAALALPAFAQEPGDEAKPENFNVHVQSTYVWERKGDFNAPYSGLRSLSPQEETAYSFSATAAFGLRLWRGAELYFNPEVVQGVPLSGLTGLGGMTNGEQQKTGGPNPTFYRARLFLRQSFDLGGEKVAADSDMNQLAGMLDRRRIVMTAGNLSVIDLFDNNPYAHDPRTQFLNWALTTHGAYDFAADARGYTWGAAVEYFYDDWALRYGRFMQPEESNGLPLDTRLFRHYGDQVEIEHAHRIGELNGKLRFLAFRNRAAMGSFAESVDLARTQGGVPDIATTRRDRTKLGYGIGLEQEMTKNTGVFARASWNDGQEETWAFTEIERSLALGATFKGAAWKRERDTVGVALVRNGLSGAHQAYLAAGGYGVFIGDGRLNYRPETIAEAYYSLGVGAHAWLTLDLQHIANPAYNADRGPVTVASLRLHASY
ncbi:carbohydrate porin [Noviherbaspirillum pedocola]|nr:carbohydrate porin [Noviherbaspirillum pedocola]